MTVNTVSVSALEDYWKTHLKDIVEDYRSFLRFASIGAESEYETDTLACAQWVRDYLSSFMEEVDLWETNQHPTVFGQDLRAGPEKPTVIIYNHYDVQPVEPLDAWESPPFEPEERNGAMYARGAQDNKGQCFYVLSALKALKKLKGEFPVNIKILIEGDEETGSSGLAGILQERQQALQGDYLLVVDVGIRDAHTPSVTCGLRGLVALEVTCRGSQHDLHSGSHGGLAYNPLRALVEILSRLYHADGSIAVPGIYETVREADREELEQYDFNFDADAYEEETGSVPSGGEQTFSPLERNWLRPALDINGISGGYAGAGFKTVIPSSATAKLSCRLVPDQDPDTVGQLIVNFLAQLAPQGIEVDARVRPGGGPAIRSTPHSAGVKAAAHAFEEVFRTSCQFILEGASIPIVAALQQTSQAEAVLLGLGLSSDLIHAPNEHFGLDRLEKGFLIIARTLIHLSGGETPVKTS